MLKKAYNEYVVKHGLKPDSSQQELIAALEPYIGVLKPNIISSLIKNLHHLLKPNRNRKWGFYIWGDVGRGKSVIMDLFYEALAIKQKRRIHFHNFMLEFHANLQLTQQKKIKQAKDSVSEVAADIAAKYKVLCLDELQVNNIADAMILARLFRSLSSNDVFIIITSNRIPGDLFKDGLKRERFIPFIDMIINHYEIFNLNGNEDYRLKKISEFQKLYHFPLNKEAENFINESVETLTGSGRNKLLEKNVEVELNRNLIAFQTYGTIALFSFGELCDIPLGVADYIALCNNFSTIIIENIPQMSADDHNQALRFITLVDCMYDHGTKLICTAATDISRLYNGQKNRFEFERTISRLQEMQSVDYINTGKKREK